MAQLTGTGGAATGTGGAVTGTGGAVTGTGGAVCKGATPSVEQFDPRLTQVSVTGLPRTNERE